MNPSARRRPLNDLQCSRPPTAPPEPPKASPANQPDFRHLEAATTAVRKSVFTVADVDVDEFWLFLERSARESDSPQRPTCWLEGKLNHVTRAHIVDFQAHLDAARRP